MQDRRPPLPKRPATNRAIAATLRLWQDYGCTDLTTLQRIATALREPSEAGTQMPRGEIDGIRGQSDKKNIGHGHPPPIYRHRSLSDSDDR
ncbi:hypothetical protein [Nocardia sp. NPDC003963]